MSGRIVWLASYPKSGNTWVRTFLSNYLNETAGPADINNLPIKLIASGRSLFDDALTISSSDMTQDEIDTYRPEVYRELAANAKDRVFLKAHDAFVETPRAQPLFPADASASALYIVRNPFDLAVSFAHHRLRSIDDTIDFIGRSDASLSSSEQGIHTQLRQRLLSWSEHVNSWLDQNSIPVHLMRYEDMHATPCETFGNALDFVGLPRDSEQLQKALRHSEFGVLRRQEQEHGFEERAPLTQAFFRSGRAGAWRNVLTEEQVQKIVSRHDATLRRLGYLEGETLHA